MPLCTVAAILIFFYNNILFVFVFLFEYEVKDFFTTKPAQKQTMVVILSHFVRILRYIIVYCGGHLGFTDYLKHMFFPLWFNVIVKEFITIKNPLKMGFGCNSILVCSYIKIYYCEQWRPS